VIGVVFSFVSFSSSFFFFLFFLFLFPSPLLPPYGSSSSLFAAGAAAGVFVTIGARRITIMARAAAGARSKTRVRKTDPEPRKTTPGRAQAPAKRAAPARPPGSKAGRKIQAYDPLAPARVEAILERLDELYPKATCALTHRSAWELLVATILSAQSTDVRVNLVTPALFKKYPSVRHFAASEPGELEPDVRSTGFFRNKSKAVVGAARKIVAEFGGEVPSTMDELLTLPGVARKTANVVLGTWFGKGVGVVVDTHVRRISRRLELTRHSDPGNIEKDLLRILPPEKRILFSHQVIWHGRRLCLARRPKCAACRLEDICHAGDKTWSTVPVHPGAQA
jgi:endonuclease-3